MDCKLHWTNVKCTPYGTKQQLAIKGRAFVQLAATGGNSVDSVGGRSSDSVDSFVDSVDSSVDMWQMTKQRHC